MRRGVVLCTAALLTVSACSVLLDFSSNDLQENTSRRCSDGVDNDENGLTDCAEPGCAQFDFCAEHSEAACQDRVDNDMDSFTDCLDPGCGEYPHCVAYREERCSDQTDNEGEENLLVDCTDFLCRTEPHCCDLKAVRLDFEPDSTSQQDPCLTEFLGQTVPYATGLEVAAVLTGEGNPAAGVTLTWQHDVPLTDPCDATAGPPLDRVAGALLTRDASDRPVLALVVDGAQEWEQVVPGSPVAVFMRLDSERFLSFYIRSSLEDEPAADALPDHRSSRPLPDMAAPLRVAFHGGSAAARVTHIVVRDRAICADPVPVQTDVVDWRQGRVLAPDPAGWDPTFVADPCPFEWDGRLHLAYAGGDAQTGVRAIGLVESESGSDDATWIRSGGERPVLEAELFGDWVGSRAELFAPSVVVLGETLRLYATVARVEEDGQVVWSAIVAAEHGGTDLYDPAAWQPVIQDPERPGLVFEPRNDRWDRAVSEPAVIERPDIIDSSVLPDSVVYLMLYTGRSDPADPFTARIGLATSADGLDWRRSELTSAQVPLLDQPENAPPQTALSSPALVWDEDFEVFRLWYLYRVGSLFTIHHAASADAIHWAHFPDNPVLQAGEPPWCDDAYLDGPGVLLEPGSGLLRFFYHGKSETGGHAICYARNRNH